MSNANIYGFGIAALFLAGGGLSRLPATPAANLTIREEPKQIVLAWRGKVAEPMRDQIAAAIDKYRGDSRRIIITLNSPGGSVSHGHKVMEVIHAANYLRPVDTYVEKGGMCASMCVPIFLTGGRRTADPAAKFMFHEASLSPLSKLPNGESTRTLDPQRRKWIENAATTYVFRTDIGRQRINPIWLEELKTRIVGRDVWLDAQQLVDEHSGVVDGLAPQPLAPVYSQ